MPALSSSVYSATVTVNSGSTAYFSSSASSGQVLGLVNAGGLISVSNSNAYTVYLLNSTNYALWASNGAINCINVGCSTHITTNWVYPYSYSVVDTYYIVITCWASSACLFNLNFNLAGKIIL